MTDATHALLHFCPMSTGRPEAVTIEKAFAEDELQRLDQYCAGLPLEHDVAGPGGEIRHNRRDVYAANLANNAETSWFFTKLSNALQRANTRLRIAVWGIAECARYSVYREGRHCWHVDSWMPDDGALRPPRKLSFELLLSPSTEYEGGAREFLGGAEKFKASRERGALTVFPSSLLTRVDHVTGGARRSIDGWASGPEFR